MSSLKWYPLGRNIVLCNLNHMERKIGWIVLILYKMYVFMKANCNAIIQEHLHHILTLFS
jgi:hypothetical protein